MTDTPNDNRDQREYWNGITGERWVKNQPTMDRAIRPFGRAAMDRLRLTPGEHVLDVGCGSGDTVLELAERLGPTGKVVGADISRPMLDHARVRTANIPGIRLLEADVSTHAFDEPFDAIFSRFGVMFFAQPVPAFAHLRRALASGGRLAFVCWQNLDANPWSALPLAAARPVLVKQPEPIVPGAPGPFAFADRDHVHRILSGAGFSDIDITPFVAPYVLSEEGVEAAIDQALRIGPVSRVLAEQPDAVKASIRERLGAAFEGAAEGQRVALDGAVWVVAARA